MDQGRAARLPSRFGVAHRAALSPRVLWLALLACWFEKPANQQAREGFAIAGSGDKPILRKAGARLQRDMVR